MTYDKIYVNDDLVFSYEPKRGFRLATLEDLEMDLGCGGEAFARPVQIVEGIVKFNADKFDYEFKGGLFNV